MAKGNIPVTKNQVLEVAIEDLTHEGAGVAKIDGYALFIPKALPGEQALVKVIKVNKGFGFGRLLEVIKKSEDRVDEPPCQIFDQCGGCQLQHLSYDGQLKQKQKQVRDVLERIGKITDVVVYPTLGMGDPWRYRNKAQVPFAEREGGLIAGFYQERSHEIIDMNSCLIQHEENDKVVQAVREIATKYGVRGYNEEKHQGTLRHVVARYGVNTGQLMVVLVTRSRELPNKNEVIEAIKEKIPNITSIVQNINSKRTNVIFGDETVLLWGEEYIYDTIGDVKFAISARSFYQVNPEQTKVLYDQALQYANLTGSETVIDAYCGIGTISLFLAQRAKRVYGVEIVPEAIDDAKRNAKLNQMDNVDFAVGEAEKVIPWWYAQGIRADCIVVDPPRKGCDEALLETIIKMKPKRVVYVSCNPATLARDLRVLEDGGFKTIEVQPVDMFPHTNHCEVVARIELINE
ncbi:23S rRNA (uracil(1939)-C(5))-methyltransferase RlmD [Anaerobacillus isosaccharinicus]|uniref:23S rRNA (Uracil(1939)-C(5))-methyltransferase RlmD n=1 Tax=Anaerobacillus isosaccharinicus TaxID=1532552 RepID=A0A1S2L502_9BACI|nr:23S rRNA (uracil(1939)-C(5))-methyltransferase RlmD [Anaerobacillus isosaccharinicus]MBA5588729.1 23S rRNA (uracil(1939)-C(5))-methyltransferase RlmD [Anaerobacillus isosaccharinicus]QOY37871.1 23S rRNA (uracil(1939)-C(5))-methyltransferase RlmD [Anaerobacillus isosaccharinicus]